MKSTQELLDTATTTYNGKTGCACGCGGDYADANTPAGQKRISKILKADPEKVVFVPFGNGEGCVEIENRDGTRVTRVYVKVEAQMKQKKTITYQDLLNALIDERHLGNGYAIRSYTTDPRKIVAMDEMVVLMANKEGWDLEQLFQFTNSKFGRYVVDCWMGGDKDRAQMYLMDFKSEMASWEAK